MVDSEYQQFWSKLDHILDGILRHGFGEMKICISTQKENSRQVIIVAGRSYHFVLRRSDSD